MVIHKPAGVLTVPGKTKDLQDVIENLIALCRDCHEKAHANIYTKEFLTETHEKQMKIFSND